MSDHLTSQLAFKRTLPRIHVLSDVHLESGPYELPSGLEFDILVAAGDIGPVDQAVPWLAKLGKPVVYVLGNHERYGTSVEGAVAQAKALSHGTQVHVLEQDSVVLQGVRFLGATLWTAYGGWSKPLVHEALRRMNDFRDIELGDWLTGNRARQREFWSLCRRADLVGRNFTLANPGQELPTKFHPAVAYMLHQRSVRWLERELKKAHELPTVVVTHHAPAKECLVGKRVDAELLDERNWDRYHRHDKLIYVAAYASDLSELLTRHRDEIDLWVHGHLHAGQDLLVKGVRVLSNPRGRYIAPLTADSVRGYAWFGISLTDADVQRSQALAQEEPYRGNSDNFDAHLTVDLAEGPARPLALLCAPVREQLQELKEQAKVLVPLVGQGSALQAEAVERWFKECVESFSEVARQLQESVFSHLDRFGNCHVLSAQGTHVVIPYLPWRREEWTAEDLARVDRDAQAFLDFLDEIPTLPARFMRKWAESAVKGLEHLESQGLPAQVVRPGKLALRRLDEHDLRFVVPGAAPRPPYGAPVDEEAQEHGCQAIEVTLDELINGRPPRQWYIGVQTEPRDWHGRLQRKLWSLESLRRALS